MKKIPKKIMVVSGHNVLVSKRVFSGKNVVIFSVFVYWFSELFGKSVNQ